MKPTDKTNSSLLQYTSFAANQSAAVYGIFTLASILFHVLSRYSMYSFILGFRVRHTVWSRFFVLLALKFTLAVFYL